MIRSAATAEVDTKTSRAKKAEPSIQGTENLLEQNAGTKSGLATGFPSTKKGFDLTQVPAKPGLQTGLRVQCCAKDGKPCSCSTCRGKSSGEDEFATAKEFHNSVSPMQSAAPTETSQSPTSEQEDVSPENSESEAGTLVAEQSSGLIVDDASADLKEGQMKKTDFLRQLRNEICGTIGPVLAKVGQTTEGCPYLNYWLDLYQEKTSAEVEATIRRYAPDSVKATTAAQYVSVVTQRALRSAVTWAATGRISGIPEGVPTTVPGEQPPPQTATARETQGLEVMTKAKDGRSRKIDDPAEVQKELGAGEPLSSGIRSRMEPAFGTNLSHVRVHTNTAATGLSNRVNARAFAVGNHVAFGSNEYQPGTLIGDALIAHELAHVMQQRGSGKSIEKMEVGNTAYNALEADADQTAMGVVSSLWSQAKDGFKGMAQRTLPMLRSGVKIQRCSKDTGPACSTTETQTINNAKKRANGWVTTVLPKLETKPVPADVSTSLKKNFGATDGVTANLPGIISKIKTANTEMTTVPVTCAGTEDKTCASACGYTPGAGAHSYVICRNKTLTPTSNPDFQAGCVLHEAFHSAFSDFSGDSYSGWGGISSSTPGYPGSDPLKNADSYTSMVIDLK
jgi:Domain of unknown function (DUF4157)